MTRSVPELSLKAFTEGDAAARAAFSADLMGGLMDYGFIILADHGVQPELLARAYAESAALFALPEAEKRRYAKGLRGYTPFGTEHAKDSGVADLKEFWQIGHEPPPADAAPDEAFPANVWPQDRPGFRDTFSALFAALNETGLSLLRALAPQLGVAADYFDARVRYGTSILRVLHYPPTPPGADPRALRAAPHEDINFLTLLVAAKGAGLELLDRDGTWLPVETDPRNLIVDSGDMLQRLTNGMIPATTHRVVNPTGPNLSRYSMPFFLHPTLATSLAPLPACRGDGPKWPEVTAGEFLAERLTAIGLGG